MTRISGIRDARNRYRKWITNETVGGLLLLFAATVALIWANSPWRDSYASIAEFPIGPEALHLHLNLATWAADGLLAIFFFVVGVELKHELVAGSLRNPKEAAVPVFAAIGGMLLPAAIFVLIVNSLHDHSALHGWAIPTATDIAFALAVLAIFGKGLPKALRTCLLTLAVVDDLLAIIVIALFYTETINIPTLLASLGCIALFGLLVRARRLPWYVLVPLALVAWGFMHASGVHATIAGVLLGLTVPARTIHGEAKARTQRLENAIRPIASGFALPVFAFFAAGVTVIGGDGITSIIAQPIVVAIVLGLILGKLIGILGVTALVTRFTKFRLPDAIGLRDLLPIGFLAGIGFTVSLLIAELSFPDTAHTSGAKIAVLLATAIAATLAAIMLRWDSRKTRTPDMNNDGITDTNVEPIN